MLSIPPTNSHLLSYNTRMMKLLLLVVVPSAVLGVQLPSTSNELSKEVVDYTTSLIQHFSHESFGTFDCWFYESLETSSVLNPIVVSEKLSSVPRKVLLGNKIVQVQRQPAMLVMISDSYRSRDLMVFLWSTTFNQYMKIVVYYSTDAQYHDAVFMFRTVFLYNVIFIRVDRLVVRFVMFYKNEHYEKSGHVPFGEVFVRQDSDLGGYVVKISTSGFRHEVQELNTAKKRRHLFEWASEAVYRMNASYRFYPIICESYAECSRKSVFVNSSAWYDFCIDKYALPQMPHPLLLPSVVPGLIGIAAPRGRKLSAFEIFVVPFRYGLWIVLLMLLAFCSTLMLFGTVQNDLILLALCGYERKSLHRVSRFERLITIALVILFFLLKCSYESKLVALLTNVPHIGDPRTLEDLIEANITIRNVALNETPLCGSDDPRLKKIFVKNHNHLDLDSEWDPRDRTKAYFGDYHPMSAALRAAKFYDFQNKRSYFAFLDGFTGSTVTCRPIQYRSALGSKLTTYERAFLEAGLFPLTADKISNISSELSYNNLIQDNGASSNVGITELLPAWYLLSIGWTVSSLVLIVEWIKKICYHRYRRWLDMKCRPVPPKPMILRCVFEHTNFEFIAFQKKHLDITGLESRSWRPKAVITEPRGLYLFV